MAHVSEIYTYPLKSGAAQKHAEIALTNRGLRDDRNWMLVWAEGEKALHHFTQREPGGEKLAQVHTHLIPSLQDVFTESAAHFISAHHLQVANPNLDENRVARTAFVHGNPVSVLDSGDDAATWFSDLVGQKVRLVRFDESRRRHLDNDHYGAMDTTALADGGPVLVTSTSSFDALRPHFNNVAVKMGDFRPNIVIDGLDPWIEDWVRLVRIGNAASLELVKPCTRCSIPTINQITGERYPDDQPTRALVAQRRGKGGGLQGVFFGQNAAVAHQGIIRVGDKVEIKIKPAPHPAVANAHLRYIPA